jgi:hypothetical protein
VWGAPASPDPVREGYRQKAQAMIDMSSMPLRPDGQTGILNDRSHPRIENVTEKEGKMNESFAQYAQYIPLLIPIMLLELGLMVFALIDLNKRTATRGPKWVWIGIIVLFNLIGPIAYLLFGRREE